MIIQGKIVRVLTDTILLLLLSTIFACSNEPGESSPDTTVSKEEPERPAAATAGKNSTGVDSDNRDRQALFGDLHVHTSFSLDSYMSFVRSTPRDAYRFARGEAVTLYGGRKKQLKTPLDFVAVTEHAEFLGEYALCSTPGSRAYEDPLCSNYRNETQDRQLASDLFRETMLPIFTSPVPQRWSICGDNGELCRQAAKDVWQEIQQANEEFNEPGKFTTLIGYEWTGQSGGNRHRNVIFRNSDVPNTPWSQFEVPTVEELWHKLDEECQAPCEAITISHNSNQSKGLRFSGRNSNGTPLSEEDAAFRIRHEPLVEIIQQKGDSECRLGVGTNDEACDFQKFDLRPICSVSKDKNNVEHCVQVCDENGQPKGCIWKSNYVRNALKIGLQLEEKLQVNPYKLGFVGSTDHHNANPGDTQESEYQGAHGYLDDRVEDRLKLALAGGYPEISRSAGGLAGVWAEENTRDSIFAALKRKETFATSGNRIVLRFFGGWNYPQLDHQEMDISQIGYAGGVAMGGDLPANQKAEAPSFLVWAMKAADGSNLQRIQLVKGWVDKGVTRERVFDVVCADGLQVDPHTQLCPDNGARVDSNDCSVTPNKGAVELQASWVDPEFDASQSAFYYARVLENPSCRWSTYDALRNKQAVPTTVPYSIQERAWSSPIWYSPSHLID